MTKTSTILWGVALSCVLTLQTKLWADSDTTPVPASTSGSFKQVYDLGGKLLVDETLDVTGRIKGYKDIVVGTATFTNLTINGGIITGITGRVLQVVYSSSSATTTTTSTSFVDTVLKRNITPTSSSSKIVIIAASEIGGLIAGKSAFITIARNGTDLSGGSGFTSDILVNASGAFRQPWSAIYVDSPASTSAVNYTIQIKNGALGGINLNDDGGIATMILIEVL